MKTLKRQLESLTIEYQRQNQVILLGRILYELKATLPYLSKSEVKSIHDRLIHALGAFIQDNLDKVDLHLCEASQIIGNKHIELGL